MNTTFNLSRFLKVLSNEWRLNSKKMLLFWGGLVILTVIYFVYFRYVDRSIVPEEATLTLLFCFACILQGFYLQFYFPEFTSKTKTQALLLLPASRTETFWAKFFLGVILYLALFSVFSFITFKWNGIHNEWIKELTGSTYRSGFRKIFVLEVKLVVFLVWLFSASAYLFGTLLFKKFAAIKSLALWFTVIMGLVLITCIIAVLFFGVWPSFAVPGIGISFSNKEAIDGEFMLIQMYPKLLYGLGLFICLALIGISRIKYNEKTI